MLTEKLSDCDVLEKLIIEICNVFSGSDGKLTVITHKISVLQVRFFFEFLINHTKVLISVNDDDVYVYYETDRKHMICLSVDI